MKNKKESGKTELLVCCQLFYPELISTGLTLTELCESLSDAGVDIEVLCAPPTIMDRKSDVPETIIYKGITIKRVWSTRFPKLNITGKLTNHITYTLSILLHLIKCPEKPVLVLTNPPLLAPFIALILKIKKIPFIYLIFDVYPDTAANMGLIKKNSFIARIWEYLNSLTLNSAAAVIVIGRCMKKKIIKKMKHKNTEKIKCIHVWSNDKLIESFSEEESPFIERWNLYNKFILLYSGNMGRFHDMETIIAAAKELRNHQDILFLFVGEGHKKQWLINYSKKHSLTNCQFHSYVKREELGPLLAAADAGLVSLCSGQEGLSVPSKTFGLMAAGLPVIAVMNSTAEIALIIKEEQSGIVTRPGEVKELTEAILSLYKDSFKREQMGKNSLNAIHKKYNLHKATQYYLNIIEDLQL